MDRGKPFPQNPDDFELDERCDFVRHQDKWILVDKNNEQWEWNAATRKWFQPATEEEIRAYQQGYGGAVDEENDNAQQPQSQNKRKKAQADEDAANKKPKVHENRAIYISNLPLDTTSDELKKEFSKYGIIDVGMDKKDRITMYADDEGNFKGEALIVYFKRDSVFMAINMADDYWFRPGDAQTISVQEADQSYKRHKDGQEVKMVRRDKKQNERNRAELNRKLAEWSDDDEVTKEVYKAPVNKWAKYVIMNNLFTLQELEDDPSALADIKEEVFEDAEKHGEVTKVVIYDKEPHGIVAVRFKEIEQAQAFTKVCDGRQFDGRTVSAWQAEDRPKYKKSKEEEGEDDE